MTLVSLWYFHYSETFFRLVTTMIRTIVRSHAAYVLEMFVSTSITDVLQVQTDVQAWRYLAIAILLPGISCFARRVRWRGREKHRRNLNMDTSINYYKQKARDPCFHRQIVWTWGPLDIESESIDIKEIWRISLLTSPRYIVRLHALSIL